MADPLVDQIWNRITNRIVSQVDRYVARPEEQQSAAFEAAKLAQAQALYAQQQANYGAIVSGTGLAQGVYGGGYAQPWSPASQYQGVPTYPPGLATIWANMRTQAANGNWEKVLTYIGWISQLTGNFGGQFDGSAVGHPKDISHDPIFSLSELEQAQDLVEEIEGSRA